MEHFNRKSVDIQSGELSVIIVETGKTEEEETCRKYTSRKALP